MNSSSFLMPPPPPPPPPSNGSSKYRDPQESTLLLVSELSEECHKLRQELIQQTNQIEEQQKYINELEETIRDLSDDYESKIEIIERLTTELEAMDKASQEKDRQHAKQLSQLQKTFNEDLEGLLQDYLILEKENANLKSYILQMEDLLNERNSEILDNKAQLREYEALVKERKVNEDEIGEIGGISILNETEEIQKENVETTFASLSGRTLDDDRVIIESKEVDPHAVAVEVKRPTFDSTRTNKSAIPSLTTILKKKFSESDEEDDDLSPDKLTIRRDLSNKHHHQRLKSHSSSSGHVHDVGSIDTVYPRKSVTFSPTDNPSLPSTVPPPVESTDSKPKTSSAWKNEKKHLNVFQKIEMQLQKSYFSWESGESAPSSPERPVKTENSSSGSNTHERKEFSSSSSFRRASTLSNPREKRKDS
eukprot:gene14886-16567_t